MKKFLALAAVALALLARPAAATPITGDVAIAGASAYTSTGIHFNGPAIVLIGTGNFLSLVGTFIHVEPQLTFASPTGFLFDVDPNGPAMDVLTLSVISNSANFLNVSGTAMMSEAGFTDTLYDYTLTATRPDGVTSFTMTAVTPSAVPEPGTLFLMGTGLMAAGMLYRWRRRKLGDSKWRLSN